MPDISHRRVYNIIFNITKTKSCFPKRENNEPLISYSAQIPVLAILLQLTSC